MELNNPVIFALSEKPMIGNIKTTILTLIILLSSLETFSQRRREVYMGSYKPLPSHSFSKTNSQRYVKSLRRQRSVFGRTPRYSKSQQVFSRKLKAERRGFRKGMTRGIPNAMANNRHNQKRYRNKKFPFIFQGNKNFYRGKRSKLGLYRMK